MSCEPALPTVLRGALRIRAFLRRPAPECSSGPALFLSWRFVKNSRKYTKRCRQIATLAQLTAHRAGRSFQMSRSWLARPAIPRNFAFGCGQTLSGRGVPLCVVALPRCAPHRRFAQSTALSLRVSHPELKPFCGLLSLFSQQSQSS
jgi:hypothetical protein